MVGDGELGFGDWKGWEEICGSEFGLLEVEIMRKKEIKEGRAC